MGRVTTVATIENMADLVDYKRGRITNEQVRRVTITEALVDSGATGLALPSKVIKALGLDKIGEKRASSADGSIVINLYEAVRLTIMNRDMPIDPVEVPDDTPTLIGQIPLEMFDLVIDLPARKLIGNPAHNGEQILELY